MLRKLIVAACLAMAAAAQAGEAGKLIFVAGSAQVLGQPAVEGASVQEGELLQTGADGFIYVKTIDNGLFILRPNTKARIVTYHIDAAKPENTRIKLELISGIARSKSGDAVKRARQNFRFNTPVAAIGVRGTDFTVFTDQATSRVSVLSGGVVVTGFGDACSPDGIGPCEGQFSRELSASQRGKLLQVQRGAMAPVVIAGDNVLQGQSPQPLGAPVATVTPAEQTLDTLKSEQLTDELASQAPAPAPSNPGTQGPGGVDPSVPGEPSDPVTQVPEPANPVPPVVVPAPEPLRHSGIVWGRWVALAGSAPDFSLIQMRAKHELVGVSGNFAVFRTAGQKYVAPERGSIGFKLANGEAYVFTHYGATSVSTAATLSNGKLNIDFSSRSFVTSFDATARDETFSLMGAGVVSSDGTLYGDRADGRLNFINVEGLLSNDRGGRAAYVFDGKLDERRSINGVSYWSLVK